MCVGWKIGTKWKVAGWEEELGRRWYRTELAGITNRWLYCQTLASRDMRAGRFDDLIIVQLV